MSIITYSFGDDNVVMSGKVFNETYPNVSLIKLTNENENHNGFQFNDGLNIDNVDNIDNIDTQKIKSIGGIHFIEKTYAHKWIYYNNMTMLYMRAVTIPDNALIYIEPFVLKANKVILGPKMPISREIYLETARNMWFLLRFMPKPMWNKEICLEAVKQSSLALHDIPIELKDKEIYMEAVKRSASALSLVPEPLRDYDICLEAVKQTYSTIMLVPIQLQPAIKLAINMSQK